jgi:hypothetical protein
LLGSNIAAALLKHQPQGLKLRIVMHPNSAGLADNRHPDDAKLQLRGIARKAWFASHRKGSAAQTTQTKQKRQHPTLAMAERGYGSERKSHR